MKSLRGFRSGPNSICQLRHLREAYFLARHCACATRLIATAKQPKSGAILLRRTRRIERHRPDREAMSGFQISLSLSLSLNVISTLRNILFTTKTVADITTFEQGTLNSSAMSNHRCRKLGNVSTWPRFRVAKRRRRRLFPSPQLIENNAASIQRRCGRTSQSGRIQQLASARQATRGMRN